MAARWVLLRTSTKEVREEVAPRRSRAKRELPVHPAFRSSHVIAGQGTAAKELIEDAGRLDYLFVPVSGAG